MPDYLQKLKDPRWQKKRLEVLDLAGWKCVWCGSDSRSLTVHHRRYRKGAEPWEYDNRELLACCEKCHGEHEVSKKRLAFMLGGFRSHALDDLERFLHMLYVVSKQKDCSPSDVLIAFTETIAGAWPEAHLFLKHRALDGDETAETILEILSEQITNNVH